MSNLKKLTALSLAAVSVLGTVASATFTDADDIKATDAVETLTALGVIAGKPDGSFDPEATVTRAEMAKMIYTIKAGGNDNADAFKGTATTFTDINGHWAEGYIKYCQSQGIIAGKSATNFDPDSAVTGTEALKMALTTLGYRADKSALTGPKWDINTLALASDNNLTDDYDPSFALGAERQYAAQILYNALYADVVVYNNQYDEYEQPKNEENLGEKYLDLDTGVTILDDANKVSVDTDDDGKNDVSNIELSRDMTKYIGQEVEVLFNAKDKVAYGVTPVDNETVVAINKFDNDLEISNTEISVDGEKVKVSNDNIFVNGVLNTKFTVADISNFDDYKVTVIENTGDKTYDAVSIETSKYRQVTSVNDDRVLAGGSFDFDDCIIDSDVEKDDMIKLTFNAYEDKDVLEVVKLQEDKVEANKSTTINTVPVKELKINGEWYKDATSNTTIEAGDTISYIESNGLLHEVEIVEGTSSDDYLVVTSAARGNGRDEFEAKVMFADGTEKWIEVDSDVFTAGSNTVTPLTTGNAATTLPAGTMVTFSEDGSYELTKMADGKEDAIKTLSGVSLDESTDKYAKKAIKNEAVIFVQHKDGFDVITGADLAAWDKTTASNADGFIVTDEVKGIDYITVADISIAGEMPGSSADTFYGILVEDAFKALDADGDRQEYITVFNGEEEVTLLADNETGTTFADLDKGDYVSYKLSTDGKTAGTLTNVTKVTTQGAVIGYNGDDTVKIITAGTDEFGVEYTIDEDTTKIVYVDSEDDNGEADGSFEMADYYKVGKSTKTYTPNVEFIANADDVIVAIFVDINNKIDGGTNISKTTK